MRNEGIKWWWNFNRNIKDFSIIIYNSNRYKYWFFEFFYFLLNKWIGNCKN